MHPQAPTLTTSVAPYVPGVDLVIVGMSGGVDSSVAALRLLEQGHRVEGLFMKNWEEDDGTDACTAREDLEDARRVCERLGIRLHEANFAAEYWDNVFESFLREYRAQRTPNPDVLCNREIKFQVFLEYAEILGAARIATGHYARVHVTPAGAELHRAVDENKDQTYFLQSVGADALARTLFPLGDLTKDEVRAIAARAGFHNHAKKDSTGICFIGERRFSDFLSRYVDSTPGVIESVDGQRLGEHRGLAFYTLGQRQGLGIGGVRAAGVRASGGRAPGVRAPGVRTSTPREDDAGRHAPWYVVGKDPGQNRLIVARGADHPALSSDWLRVASLHWIGEAPPLPLRCTVKVRHRQRDVSAHLSRRADGELLLRFDAPERAVTPGQWACLYDGPRCLGGGIIEETGRRPAVADGLAA